MKEQCNTLSFLGTSFPGGIITNGASSSLSSSSTPYKYISVHRLHQNASQTHLWLMVYLQPKAHTTCPILFLILQWKEN